MAETKVLKGINFPGLEGTYYVPEATAVEDENGYIEIKSYVSDTVEVENLDATLTKEGFAADAKAVGDKVPYIIPMIKTWSHEDEDYSYSLAEGYTYDINQIRKAIANNRVVVCRAFDEMENPADIDTYYLVALTDDNYAYFTQTNYNGYKELEIYPYDDEIQIAHITKNFISNDGPLGRYAKDINSLDDIMFNGPGWYRKWFNRDELPAGAFEGWWTLRTGYYGASNYFQIIMPTVGVTSKNYDATCELRRQYDGSRGGWLEWEWVNPPMEPGVQYRTTERYNGKPVYVCLLSSPMPSNSQDRLTLPNPMDVDNIVNVTAWVYKPNFENVTLPYISGHQITAYHWVNAKNQIGIATSADFSGFTGYFLVKFTQDD